MHNASRLLNHGFPRVTVPGVADSILGRLHDAFTASMVGTVGTYSAGTLAARPDLAHCMA